MVSSRDGKGVETGHGGLMGLVEHWSWQVGERLVACGANEVGLLLLLVLVVVQRR